MSSHSLPIQVLLIEDNPLSEFAMNRMLKKVLGPETFIHNAKNSEQAIEQFTQNGHSLQLIICDGNLIDSKHQGPELINEILSLQNKKNLSIPVFAWTDDDSKLNASNEHRSNHFFHGEQALNSFESVFEHHGRPFRSLDKPASLKQLTSSLAFLTEKTVTEHLLRG